MEISTIEVGSFQLCLLFDRECLRHMERHLFATFFCVKIQELGTILRFNLKGNPKQCRVTTYFFRIILVFRM